MIRMLKARAWMATGAVAVQKGAPPQEARPSRGDPAERRTRADTDGTRRRVRQAIEDNRLL